MAPKLKNIIFDVGKVLFDYNPEEIIRKLIPNCRTKDTYLRYLFDSEVWQILDEGLISPEEAVALLIKQYKLREKTSPDELIILIHDFLLYINDFWLHLGLMPASKQIFEELAAKNFNLYILSNFQADAFDKLLQQNPFMNLAKGMVISGKVKMKKPDLCVYQYLLDTYHLKAEECLFIDDRPENISAAQQLNINGILFTNAADLRIQLEKYCKCK